MKKKLLLIAKFQEPSLPFFLTQAIKNEIDIVFLILDDSIQVIEDFLKKNSFDYIFIRDPFLRLKYSEIRKKLEIIFKNAKDAYLIDGLQSPDDVFLEDKWLQYQKLKEFMISTYEIKNVLDLDFQKHFVKKRISSRARGIVFNRKDIENPADYIYQDKVEIDKEYRVFTIFNEILSPVMVKSSKTLTSKVRGQKLEPIDEDILKFVEKIEEKLNFDFVGHDIARLKDGSLKLIESNRSCLFEAYLRFSGVNLAEVFIKKLLELRP